MLCALCLTVIVCVLPAAVLAQDPAPGDPEASKPPSQTTSQTPAPLIFNVTVVGTTAAERR